MKLIVESNDTPPAVVSEAALGAGTEVAVSPGRPEVERRGPSYRLARFLSNILSPPVLALAVFWILCRSSATGFSWPVFLTCAATQSILPLAFLGVAVRRGHIGDINMSRREERRHGMATLAIVYGLGVALVALAGGRGPILFVSICSLAILGALWAVNLVYKASGHAAGCAAYMTAISLFVDPVHPGLVLIPAVSWARVRTGAHSVMQVILGAVLGAGVALGFYLAVRRFLL